jgi:hypothetical protein
MRSASADELLQRTWLAGLAGLAGLAELPMVVEAPPTGAVLQPAADTEIATRSAAARRALTRGFPSRAIDIANCRCQRTRPGRLARKLWAYHIRTHSPRYQLPIPPVEWLINFPAKPEYKASVHKVDTAPDLADVDFSD